MSYRCRMRCRPFHAQSTTPMPDRDVEFSTSTRIRTLRCAEHHSGPRSQPPLVDVNEDSHLSTCRAPLWSPIAMTNFRRQRGSEPFGAQNTTLVPDRNLHSSMSTRIRTLRCAEHHSGARSQFPTVDVNEDLDPSMRRTPLWCPTATSNCRRQRGSGPFDAQKTTLVMVIDGCPLITHIHKTLCLFLLHPSPVSSRRNTRREAAQNNRNETGRQGHKQI